MDKCPINICVFALTLQRYVDSKDEIVRCFNKLGFSDAVAHLGHQTQDYGPNCGDWKPYEEPRSVLECLDEVGYVPNNLTDYMQNIPEDFDKLSSLVKNVDLYFFDPLFLMVERHHQRLIDMVQGAIHQGEKSYCIIPSRSFPNDWTDPLLAFCTSRLPLLQMERGKGRGFWGPRQIIDFKGYLESHNVKSNIVQRPNQVQTVRFAHILPDDSTSKAGWATTGDS